MRECKNFKELLLFNLQTLTNFPYIEKDFDALTNYELLCKVVEYLKLMAKNIDNQNTIITNLTNAFIELKDFVDNYFSNLDVQDEINNKLDEMVEQGTLQEIIADYLNSKAIFGFDNVESMKEGTNLINGSYAKTLGYYTKNDGGGSTYKIRTITNDDIVDNATIIPLNDDSLIAELIVENEINPIMFGCIGNGTTDDTTNFQKCLNYAGINNIPIIINKLFLVNNLKLQAYEPNNIVYTLKGTQSNQRGHNAPPIKTGFLTTSNIFTTDETPDTNIQIHLDSINAENLGNTGTNCFIYNCDISRSSILNCSITNFDYIIYGSTSGSTNISDCNLKNIKKACFRVGDTSSRGFYDTLICNNYINAKHESTGFHGYPSKRTCVLYASSTLGFGEDGRFCNNFVDYFTYFIDRGATFEIGSTPVYQTTYAGLVSNNIFQYMLNMIGIGIIMRGDFDNNCFYGFCNDPIYEYLNNTNAGPFSIATYTCEITDDGDNTETYPYRKFECSKITNNKFVECYRPLYYDFDYSSYPGITASTFRPVNMVIIGNETQVQPSFNDSSVFACQFNDSIFLNIQNQLWDRINKPTIASTSFNPVHSQRLWCHSRTIAQFSDGIFIAKYNGERSYSWVKIADV